MVRFSRVGLAAVPMCYPSVIRSRKLMGHDEGNTLKSQDNHEGLRALPLNSVECGFFPIIERFSMGVRALIMASATPAAYFRGQNVQASDQYGIRGLWSPSSVAESGRRGDRSRCK